MSRRNVKANGWPSTADAGFTLVEMLVACGLFLMFIVMVMTSVVSVGRATTATREFTSMNEQARLATERVTRELRQAKEIRAVSLPGTSGGNLSMTIGVDFNDSGTVDITAADPEILTYRYDAAAKRLTLTANDQDGVAQTRPILSDSVSAFEAFFRSSLWQYDLDRDGITDWTELDDIKGVGNQNDVLDAPELARVDLVAITITVLEGARQQTYRTQASLRNQSQS